MDNETQNILKQLQEGQAQIKKHLPGIMEKFRDFSETTMGKEQLSHKFKELIATAIAVAIRCQPCIAHHVKEALDQGATVSEILEACSIAMIMGGGPSIAYTSYVVKALEDLGALNPEF